MRRTIHELLRRRLTEKRRFIQTLVGPRQVGKTTVVRQVMESIGLPSHYASADEPTLRDSAWLAQQWEIGRVKAKDSPKGALLVIDEIQKVERWSSIAKHLWDQDSQGAVALKVVLLGSAPLLIQSGLTESLAGRFEVIPAPHWSFSEMQEAFGWDLEQYLFYGGYPGAADLIEDPERWRRYIRDSLIETTLSRDILLLTRVDKPALLRRLFQLGCAYSGQILSYQKMMGQLADAGNTTTLAHYIQLLEGAGMLAGLNKYSGAKVRQRASSPKLQVLNNALMTAQDDRSFREVREDGEYWGRLVESAVGAHLLNSSLGASTEVTYWRERNEEVDFVIQQGRKLLAIEVKSAARRGSFSGMEAFSAQFKPTRKLQVGGQGIPLEQFLAHPASHWIE